MREFSRALVHADCLEVLADARRVAPGSLGLVYMDPPYATDRLFEAGLRRRRGEHDETKVLAFDDHWADYRAQGKLPRDVEAIVSVALSTGGPRLGGYIRFMAERLMPLREAMSPTGSLYLHVSPSVAPYLRLILDTVLGVKAFRNEIVWRRTHAHSSSNRYGPVHDTILFYARQGYAWHRPVTAPNPAYIEKHFRGHDSDGRNYQLVTCSAPGDRTGTAAHYKWRGLLPPPGRHWAWKSEEMRRLEEVGRIQYSSTGIPRRKYYADEHRGTPLQDVWSDIGRLDAHSDERVGFDTQKPLDLLRRVISASAPRGGELVFDGFAGTGTTLIAADEAGFGWIGCDVSLKALSLSLGRLANRSKAGSISWKGGPASAADVRHLARNDADTFGLWVTALLGLQYDRNLSAIGAIYARSGQRLPSRAVAAPSLTSAHVERLAAAPASDRYTLSLVGRSLHKDVQPISVLRLAESAAGGRVPLAPNAFLA